MGKKLTKTANPPSPAPAGSALSRQRLWQINRRSEGRCIHCAKPAPEKMLCDDCARRRGVAHRRMLRSEWQAAKWDRPDWLIAAYFGVTVQAVGYQRRKHAPNKTIKLSRPVGRRRL
jgi:hypothetical protein